MLADEQTRMRVERHVEQVFEGRCDTLEVDLLHHNGHRVSVVIRSVPVRDARDRVVRCQSAVLDISSHRKTESQLRKARDYLQHLAHHDALTDLPNRTLFLDRLRHAVHRARPSEARWSSCSPTPRIRCD